MSMEERSGENAERVSMAGAAQEECDAFCDEKEANFRSMAGARPPAPSPCLARRACWAFKEALLCPAAALLPANAPRRCKAACCMPCVPAKCAFL